jgi:hypothetical protein
MQLLMNTSACFDVLCPAVSFLLNPMPCCFISAQPYALLFHFCSTLCPAVSFLLNPMPCCRPAFV